VRRRLPDCFDVDLDAHPFADEEAARFERLVRG